MNIHYGKKEVNVVLSELKRQKELEAVWDRAEKEADEIIKIFTGH
ncbi:hypothetical protein [Clostridium sp. M62/1]